MLDRTKSSNLHFGRLAAGEGTQQPSPVKPTRLFESVAIAVNAVSNFLMGCPVIQTAEDAREANGLRDTAKAVLGDLEDERQRLVAPLLDEMREINARYHAVHNTDAKRPGSADRVVATLNAKLTSYAKAEEDRRQAEARAAAERMAEAEASARKAEALETEARDDLANGVCDIDMASIMAEADRAFNEFLRDKRGADRAERDTHVRIGGGMHRSVSLRTKETLHVTNWEQAIGAIGLTEAIAEAILTGARNYRREFGELPAGVEATTERKI